MWTLNPCSKCGKIPMLFYVDAKTLNNEILEKAKRTKSYNVYSVYCRGCGNQSREFIYDKLAVDNWNERNPREKKGS